MTNNTQTISFPFFSILSLIFITLKLTGYIAWSWWWVLSPIWGPILFVLAVFIIAFIVLVVKDLL